MNHLDCKYLKQEKEISKVKEMIHAYRDRQAAEIADEGSRITNIEEFMTQQFEKVTSLLPTLYIGQSKDREQ